MVCPSCLKRLHEFVRRHCAWGCHYLEAGLGGTEADMWQVLAEPEDIFDCFGADRCRTNQDIGLTERLLNLGFGHWQA